MFLTFSFVHSENSRSSEVGIISVSSEESLILAACNIYLWISAIRVIEFVRIEEHFKRYCLWVSSEGFIFSCVPIVTNRVNESTNLSNPPHPPEPLELLSWRPTGYNSRTQHESAILPLLQEFDSTILRRENFRSHQKAERYLSYW